MHTALVIRAVHFAAAHCYFRPDWSEARNREVLHEQVIVPLDHQHLNHAVTEFAEGRSIPTCENILHGLWPRIHSRIAAPARLHALRLHEDDRLFVDYSGAGSAA